MRAHRETVTVPDDHRVAITLPDDFPAGAAEVIVLAQPPGGRAQVKLGGALGPEREPPADSDPIAEALDELRAARRDRLGAAKPRS
jgi:hypothetical protein